MIAVQDVDVARSIQSRRENAIDQLQGNSSNLDSWEIWSRPIEEALLANLVGAHYFLIVKSRSTTWLTERVSEGVDVRILATENDRVNATARSGSLFYCSGTFKNRAVTRDEFSVFIMSEANYEYSLFNGEMEWDGKRWKMVGRSCMHFVCAFLDNFDPNARPWCFMYLHTTKYRVPKPPLPETLL